MAKSLWSCTLVIYLTLLPSIFAGDDTWLSPIYKALYSKPLPIPPDKLVKHKYTNPKGHVINYYEVEIKPFQKQVYPNLGKANLVGYDGMSPGPTFRMEKGEEAGVRFINHGTMDNSVHLHGSYSRAPFDGWAEDTTRPGQYKDYYYPNDQRGRTLWYHDHAIMHTAENAYFGQAGFYILHDKGEDKFKLPKGDYDIPLCLSSKQYKSNGDLLSPASERTSLYGDVIHVNGEPWPYLEVEPRKYRFRILDAAISRAFVLYLEKDTKTGTKLPFQVIASDAGLLSRPVTTSTLEIAMAERWEIVVDFSSYANSNVTMRNNRDVQADEDYNSTDKVMKFIVKGTVVDNENNDKLPDRFDDLKLPSPKTTVDIEFRFERTGGEWTVNGVVFSDVRNRILQNPPRGSTQVWELQNNSGGWSHPVHIHLVDFQIISRTAGKRNILPYEEVGLKDVVLLGTNEKVRVIAKYAPWDGVYMFHCHNLIHEDHDMMAAFNVTSLPDWGYPETTKFLDPMEERWRSKNYDDSKFTEQYIMTELLPAFSGLDAYEGHDDIEESLDDYYKDLGKDGAKTTLSRVTSSAHIPSSTGSTLSILTAKETMTTSPNSKTTSTGSAKTSTATKKKEKD